jgi:hypothetical protein
VSVTPATWISLARGAVRGYDRTMLWRIALACLVLAGGVRGASANGRLPATSTITFRQGHENDIVIGLTFGLVISHDGGKTWAWMCENAIPYQGVYDPQFMFGQGGELFATSFNGLKVVRDSCTFNLTPVGTTFPSAATEGPDHALYAAVAQAADADHNIPADFRIYKSTDDGVTFPPPATPPTTTVNWWQSLQVASSDPQRLYLTGFAYVPGPGGVGTTRQQLLFRSDNGGTSWIPLTIDTGVVTVTPNSLLDIVGIDKTDPNLVYMRVKLDVGLPSDLYRSTDKGVTWAPIRHKDTLIGGFVVRAALNSNNKHDVVAATTDSAEISHDNGTTWTTLANAPHISCLVENAAGELWACTQNYGYSSVPSDDAGVMKTTDLTTWTKVLRYQDLKEAVSCATGTLQRDNCVATWCAVCAQLGCTPSPSYGCVVPGEAPPAMPPESKGGCCDSGGSGGAGALALALSVGMVLWRPRRRRGP